MYFSTIIAPVFLSLLAGAAPTPEQGSRRLSIPLAKRDASRRSDGTVDMGMLKANLRSSMAKIHRGLEAFERNMGTEHSLKALMAPRPTLEARQTGTGSTNLTSDSQILWFGTISVGTPAKEYKVDFDTGSSDLFLPGPSCDTSCSGHTVYDPSASSTSADVGQSFQLSYGDGSMVSGEQFTDTVSVGGLGVTAQTLGAASTYSTGFESPGFPADGLMGLAFPSISVYGANPFFQTLASSNKLKENVFGFKLSVDGAELSIGGTDAVAVSGELSYTPVTQEGYWQISMDAVSVNGQDIFAVSSTSAIVDTGTTLIVGDTQSVQNAHGSISGAQDNGDGTWSIPCDSTPTVSVTIGGQAFDIAPETFVLHNGDGTCISGLSYDDAIAGQFWILGDTFLQNVYTAFDVGNSQVGFGKLA